MTTIDLDQVNRERRHKGLPPLTRDQAYSAMRERPTAQAASHDSGFDTTGFLIGYMTGIPMPSAGGIVGAMLHDSGHHSSGSSSSSYDPPAGGGSFGGGGASSSWDSGSSSSSSSDSSSSSSSSSSDSGSSSSGGGSD